MLSSLEIAQQATLRPIAEIAADAGLEPDEIEFYGRYKAKVNLSALDKRACGDLVRVLHLVEADRAKARIVHVRRNAERLVRGPDGAGHEHDADRH